MYIHEQVDIHQRLPDPKPVNSGTIDWEVNEPQYLYLLLSS
jgi:hypothetical protein